MSDTITFWGVRGSIACPFPGHMAYGGNTSCVALGLGGQTVILDAGTGIRALGASAALRGVSRLALLFSHVHRDHIEGFPFFAPAHDRAVRLDIFAGPIEGASIRQLLDNLMSRPMFPLSLDQLRAQKVFHDLPAATAFTLFERIKVRTAALNHPGGATAYRFEHGGRVVCYVTDTEHRPGQPDAGLLELIAGADYVLYDSTYTDREFAAHRGWGHSTWEEGVRLCRQAGARHLVIFHHDPDHDDAAMAAIETAARAAWGGTLVAREGMTIALDSGVVTQAGR
ncbi:MBL fold metallo-hydrolase [Rhodospirillum rubrum]|uniref:Beta-lactamase-like n=1 Tax=Rhodospirillum rubrum (strain ATCC 11170 / ATH 1.1.1 / DSM 467 / LMG 4362 / NCIMB 8255 / S1) TaxID=269796 RepID=Q2RTD4_RHORT|nr:MBL fold metallo-hydrolase [Rhodospirillum rubrum]ABC22611.1 Beta-lactamase-like [Rhodospirillum rubrum ATCC 11170]AEO48329.1 beta-lactamase-like protein [Rhodospirillum rubrum F11]MBK5954199.1 MBL fold metallo-hydrolase [Rhodospirillum rubrum]QXG82235.1 MBL fold metallo-hydrolase [Rhodospirillum rubrum]